MNNELQTIASMEFGKAVHRLAKEKESSLRTALAGLSRGGPQVAARRDIELEYAEKMCTALAEIWVKLLEGTNGGILTRQHVEFIKEQVQGAASARRGSLMNGPPMAPNQEAVAGHIARQMDIVTANVCRDVELRLRRQEVGLPKEESIAASAFPQSGQQQGGGADPDRNFARLAIDEARKSVPENDGKPHPWVGAVVVKDGKVLSSAHRGEVPGNHAEFTALERNLSDVAVAGATVYVTLEPCTTRNRPKIPCADRLIERRIKRVVVGMLDPDDRIRGKGHRKLTNAGIEFSFFPHDLAMEVEELNREFTRFCEQSVRIEVGPVNMELWKEVATLRADIAELRQSEKERAEFENFPVSFVFDQGSPGNFSGVFKNDSRYKVSIETIQILRGDTNHESVLTEAVKPRPTDDWTFGPGEGRVIFWGPQHDAINMLRSLVQSPDPNFPQGKVIPIATSLTFKAEGRLLSKKFVRQVLIQGNQFLPWGP